VFIGIDFHCQGVTFGLSLLFNQSAAGSFHLLFIETINAVFLFLSHPLICSSLTIAKPIGENIS